MFWFTFLISYLPVSVFCSVCYSFFSSASPSVSHVFIPITSRCSGIGARAPSQPSPPNPLFSRRGKDRTRESGGSRGYISVKATENSRIEMCLFLWLGSGVIWRKLISVYIVLFGIATNFWSGFHTPRCKARKYGTLTCVSFFMGEVGQMRSKDVLPGKQKYLRL